MNAFRPGGGHVLVVGQTRSGKSTAATTWASRWSRVLVFDPKADDEAVPRRRDSGRLTSTPAALVAWGVDAAARALRADVARVVYRPLPADMDDLPGSFDVLAELVWRRGGGRVVVLHETVDVAPSSGSRRYLSTLWRQGVGRGVWIMALTQRPVWIDRLARSEPATVVLFTVDDVDDRDMLARRLGLRSGRELPRPRRPYGFLAYQAGRLVEVAPYAPLPPLQPPGDHREGAPPV